MSDATRTPRTLNSSRLALAVALFLAAGFGVVASVYVKPASLEIGKVSPSLAVRQPVARAGGEGLARPRVPAADHLVEFCSRHVTEARSFVIFRYGTCVLVQEPSEDPVADAMKRLEASEDPEAKFVPELTVEGDLIVSFKEPVFHIFNESQREAMQAELNTLTPALLTPAERASAGDDWVPPTEARYGLLARRRMLEDAARPVAIKVVRAKNRVAGGKE